MEGVRAVAWVQDAGRPGRRGEGVPPGGALVPSLLARANRAVGNAPGAPALETFGPLRIEAAGETLLVATDDGVARPLRDVVTVAPAPGFRVGYVAVAGGFVVPEVLGGYGTLPTCGLGGLGGRALRKGDVLAVGEAMGAPEPITALPPRPLLEAAIRLYAGPDGERFVDEAWPTLLGSAFVVGPRFDRTGLGFTGPALARRDADDAVSAPMVLGALEVPASGEPIVLGPDHPTTGGYPVIAVADEGDLEALFARMPGAAVRFREA